MPAAVAILSLEMFPEREGWYQLLPAGHFSAVDGRPTDVPGGQWYIDQTIAERLIALAQASATELVVDYDHQTLRSADNGQPAPAAGWFKDMQWREGQGLFIKPRWTAAAHNYLANQEYRYLSAVFPYDDATGIPLRLHSAALTNRPGIDGLQPLAALSASILTVQEKSPLMNDLLKRLLEKLGVQVDANVASLSEEQSTAALNALSALQQKADSVGTLTSQLASLSEQQSAIKPDPTQFVPMAVVNDLQRQVAVLSEQSKTGALEQTLTAALKDGRLTAPMEAWARELGTKDMAALNSFLDAAKPIAALNGLQTQGKQPDDKAQGLAVLSEAEKEAMRLLGKSESEFLAGKA